MRVIAVLNQKGGSGKTTIATYMTRAFQLDGFNVLLVDSDPKEAIMIGRQCLMIICDGCQY